MSRRISFGKSTEYYGTDKTFNLTEYYGLKSVKLSDSYVVTFVTYLDLGNENDRLKYYDMFFCESIKIPSIKNEIHKTEIGSMGDKYSVFAHKPFDDVSLRLIEDDKSSVYKFIISRISKSYSKFLHAYKNYEEKFYKMDCLISITDNAFEQLKMTVTLYNCKIVNYSTSTFNSNDTSTPYMYDLSLSFEGIGYTYNK